MLSTNPLFRDAHEACGIFIIEFFFIDHVLPFPLSVIGRIQHNVTKLFHNSGLVDYLIEEYTKINSIFYLFQTNKNSNKLKSKAKA
jgi:hypothetical protein